MKTCTIWLDALDIGDRLRPVNQAKVDALAESMAAIGLQQPVTVCSVPDPDIEGAPDDVHLVAGAHRVLAALKLGWETIEAFDMTDASASEIDRELWEIDENLMRSELTTEEKREHLRRRKELWERRESEERGTPCPTFQKAGRGEKGFAADTAASTGLSKRQINRLLAPTEPKRTTAPAPATPRGEKVADIVDRAEPAEVFAMLRDALGMLILIDPEALDGSGGAALLDFIGIAEAKLVAIREAIENRLEVAAE